MSFTVGQAHNKRLVIVVCTLTFVLKLYFHTCWCFIIDILKENFLKLFPVVGFKPWKKIINFPIFTQSFLCLQLYSYM